MVLLCIIFFDQNATAAADNATASAENVQTLKTNIEELSVDTNEANGNVTSLDERANQDSTAIAATEVVVGNAESKVIAAQTRVSEVQSMLDGITMELKSLELISEEKFNNYTMQLDSINATLVEADTDLEETQQRLADLENQFAVLQERYTTLLQHRDLLNDILESISELNCRDEFM